MSMERKEAAARGATTGEQWPFCPAIDGMCLSYDLAQHVGGRIETSLMSFIFSAREGARLILQKNHSDFTVQVTGPVERAEGKPFKLSEARALRKRLDDLKSGGKKD